jgi:hypothetical protein
LNNAPSRRNFLAAGLALPAAASATRSGSGQSQSSSPARPSSGSALQFKTLGKTGMKVTTVGMGCMITSDPSVVTRAADMGINYFDTSRNYINGQNERMVGGALGARRKNVFVASKCDRNTGADILTELDTSLKELGTDYLDVWHLHGKSTPAQISDDMVAAQMKAKQQGKVRFIGVSCHGGLPAIVDRCIEAKIDVVQAQYSFAQDASWTPAVEKLAQAGIGVIAMKVMARAGGRGRGAQAPAAPQRPAGFGASAIRWVVKNPNVACTVPSMTDIDQLEENFRAMSAPFNDADSKILSARLEEIRPYYCRTCGQCDGQCPKGLPVPEMVRYVMYADGYGQFPLGRENFQRLAQEHQQVRCGDCAQCAVQCPHGVNVAQQLSRAQELFA